MNRKKAIFYKTLNEAHQKKILITSLKVAEIKTKAKDIFMKLESIENKLEDMKNKKSY